MSAATLDRGVAYDMLAWTEKKYKVKGTRARGIDTVLRHPRLD